MFFVAQIGSTSYKDSSVVSSALSPRITVRVRISMRAFCCALHTCGRRSCNSRGQEGLQLGRVFRARDQTAAQKAQTHHRAGVTTEPP